MQNDGEEPVILLLLPPFGFWPSLLLCIDCDVVDTGTAICNHIG